MLFWNVSIHLQRLTVSKSEAKMDISNRENWNIYSLRKSFLDTGMKFPAAGAVCWRYNAAASSRSGRRSRDYLMTWLTSVHLLSQHSNWVTATNNAPFKLVRMTCTFAETWTKNSIARRELNTRVNGFNRWSIRCWRSNLMHRQCTLSQGLLQAVNNDVQLSSLASVLG
jgi:hypothetical protein